MKRKFIKGFTLTELMAVVIILSLLTGVAAGTYRKAVERSRVSDGLTAASTVMSAVERYYVERGDNRPELTKLDISFPNQKTCTLSAEPDFCFKTKYFETTYYKEGYTDAVRPGGNYKIRVFSNMFGNNLRQPPACIADNTRARDLCISAGYIQCAGGGPYFCSR